MSIFSHLMFDDVHIRRFVENSPTGGKVYDPPQGQPPAVIKGRIEFERRKVMNNRGAEIISEAVLYTPERVMPGDLITYDGREWPVQVVAECKSLYSGTDHWEVRL